MRLFAITPDTATVGQLIDRLPDLQNRGAVYLYIRLPASGGELRPLIDAAVSAGIVPIVPHTIFMNGLMSGCGVHYKSSEISLLARGLPAPPRVITASSHSSVEARLALQAGANYVYVSPVYEPLSKHGDRRLLFPRDELQKLIAMYAERIVLLGGMTTQRIKELTEYFSGDFSAAGITLFFNGQGG